MVSTVSFKTVPSIRQYRYLSSDLTTTRTPYAGATLKHKMRPLQRMYFIMTDVIEDITRVQNVICSCLKWSLKKPLHSPVLFVNT
jgi:hypothetical protein